MRSLALRRTAAGLLAATALVLGAASPSAASPSRAKPSAAPERCCDFVYYFNTVVAQWTHRTPDALNSTHEGLLYKGHNYFYCQASGATYANNGRQDSVWLLTDDDTGHSSVWVSDVNLDDAGWKSFGRILPVC
jgi:hypothetical protein